jgi:NitT/TauT family transport system permease protein
MSGRGRNPPSAPAASAADPVAPVTPAPASQQAYPWTRQTLAVTGVFLCLALAWEGIKGIGGDPWRLSTNDGAPINVHFQPPLSLAFASDLNMPHLWDIAAAFLRPAQRHGPPLITVLGKAALVTMGEAVVGFFLGVLLGLVLGTVFAHAPLLERSLVPYVVASQTVPILAIAPMVIVWLQAGWWAVAIMAAYLAFFPVTINTLRGLRSSDPAAIDLMRSYAASGWTTLWKVRVPAALPYIFTALKIAATTSVVGAIIGELPSGLRDGLGGAILNFNQYYIADPAKLWATIVVAALVGLCFFVAIALGEYLLCRTKIGLMTEN